MQKPKLEFQASDDRLSNLPLGITSEILARVPIRDAVRTSVLSKEWRYTWTTIPRLIFDCDCDHWYSYTADWSGDWCDEPFDTYCEKFEERMNNIITNVLLQHKGPIYRFQMSYPEAFRMDNVEEWILCLSKKNVRELITRLPRDNFHEYFATKQLKSSIYSCTKLTRLELWDFKMCPPPPTFKGFLFLTSLVLYGVELSSRATDSLLAHCPLLERLGMMYSSGLNLRIRCPNLKDLQVCGNYNKLCLYAPLLVKIRVKLKHNDFKRIRSSVFNYTDFLRSSTNLVELRGYHYFTRFLSVGIESCHTALVFHHLKVIELSQVNFDYAKEMAVIARLIMGSPNLHKLSIKAIERFGDEAPVVSYTDYFGCAPNFKLMKMRVVSLRSVCDYHTGMELIKFLLKTSPVLETMELISFGRILSVSAQVSRFHRASPMARISVSLAD